ncbi:MAG TPA: class I SAM-dependent methyltransferase [Candidatus Limnocylindrales bacterium]
MDVIRRLARRVRRVLSGPPAKPKAAAAKPPTQPASAAPAVRTPKGVLPKDDLHAFWRDPDAPNRPEEYVAHAGRSRFLVEFVKPYLGPEPTILEIGCNVGRNLAHLYDAGYRRLTGIEINADALRLLGTTYPSMAEAATLVNAPVEEAIRDIPDDSVDLVFTMAVLEHIHPDSEWVFDDIVRVCRGTVVTVEDEHGVSRHHTPRDYREVFESRGLRQVAHQSIDAEGGFGTAFEARAFTRA